MDFAHSDMLEWLYKICSVLSAFKCFQERTLYSNAGDPNFLKIKVSFEEAYSHKQVHSIERVQTPSEG